GFNLDWSKKSIQISGKARANQFYLDGAQSGNFFDWLENIQGKMDFTVANLILPNLTLKNAKLNLSTKAKILKVQLGGEIERASISAKLDYFYNKNEKVPQLSGQMSLKTPEGSLAGEISILV